MIKSLQKRFILIAMSAVFIVLAIIMGAINLTNYHGMVKDADTTMAILEENNGYFPRPDNGKDKHISPGMSEETPFETRFFAVYMTDEGKVTSVNTGSIAAISTAQAIEYAQEIYVSGKEKGFLSRYRFALSDTENGKMVVFLDCSRGISFYRSFLKASFAVSAAGILAVFIIVLLLSKRAILPIAVSYGKQKQFITDASHELKTPLAVISANTEVLEMTQGENNWTQSIRNQVSRLTELTNSLVSLARMDEHDSRLLMTDFSLSDAVAESLEPFRQVAAQQNKRFDISVAPNLTLCGNEEAVRKLVGILADNAIKYSGERGDISVTLKSGSKGLLLQTKNTVDEIAKGSHDELFERFYRGDSSRSTATGGYGIGLSIARAIVSAHKGKITARSEDGASLTISVYF